MTCSTLKLINHKINSMSELKHELRTVISDAETRNGMEEFPEVMLELGTVWKDHSYL